MVSPVQLRKAKNNNNNNNSNINKREKIKEMGYSTL